MSNIFTRNPAKAAAVVAAAAVTVYETATEAANGQHCTAGFALACKFLEWAGPATADAFARAGVAVVGAAVVGGAAAGVTKAVQRCCFWQRSRQGAADDGTENTPLTTNATAGAGTFDGQDGDGTSPARSPRSGSGSV